MASVLNLFCFFFVPRVPSPPIAAEHGHGLILWSRGGAVPHGELCGERHRSPRHGQGWLPFPLRQGTSSSAPSVRRVVAVAVVVVVLMMLSLSLLLLLVSLFVVVAANISVLSILFQWLLLEQLFFFVYSDSASSFLVCSECWGAHPPLNLLRKHFFPFFMCWGRPLCSPPSLLPPRRTV